MRNLVFISIVVILLYFDLEVTNSQIYLRDGVRSVNVEIDSIFEIFVPPVFSNVSFDNNFSIVDGDEDPQNFLIFCNIVVDTNNKIRSLYVQPIYKFHNRFSDTSSVWKELLRSIDSVSKFWITKPVLHLIKESDTEEYKKYLEKLNQMILNKDTNPWRQPFGRIHDYCFILSIYLPLGSTKGTYEPMLFNWIEIEPFIESKNK